MCLEYDCLSMPFQLLSDLHTYPPPKFVPSYSFFLTQWTHWVKLMLLRWAGVSGHPWIMSNLPWVWPQKKSHSSSFNSQQLPIGPQLEAGPPELSLCLCWNIYQLGLVQAPPAAASSWVHWPYHVQNFPVILPNLGPLEPLGPLFCDLPLALYGRRYLLFKSLCSCGL